MGYFYAIELAKQRQQPSAAEEREWLHPRLPLRRAARARAAVPGRRPRRPRDPAVAAAGRRTRGVRPSSRRSLRQALLEAWKELERPSMTASARSSSASPPRSRPTSAGWPSPPTASASSSRHGVAVLVQAGAGDGASIPDDAYRAAGAEIVADAAEVWERADLVCKVKEPQAVGARAPAGRPHAVHLPPPGRLPRRWPRPCCAAGTTGDRLRDGDAAPTGSSRCWPR